MASLYCSKALAALSLTSTNRPGGLCEKEGCFSEEENNRKSRSGEQRRKSMESVDIWSSILSWLSSVEQVRSSACCQVCRAASESLVSEATVSPWGLASFVKGLQSRRFPRLVSLELEPDLDGSDPLLLRALEFIAENCKEISRLKISPGPNYGQGLFLQSLPCDQITHLEIHCCYTTSATPRSQDDSSLGDDDDDRGTNFWDSFGATNCCPPVVSLCEQDIDVDSMTRSLVTRCRHLVSFSFDGASKWASDDCLSSSLSDATLVALSQKLKKLRVASCDDLTDSGLARLRLPDLEALDISLCPSITKKGVETLTTRSLKEVALRGLFETIASDRVLEMVAGPQLTSLSLTTLSVLDASILTNKSLATFALNCPNLQHFDLFGEEHKSLTITKDGLLCVARHCPKLESFKVRAHCTSDDTLRECLSHLPLLKVVEADPKAWTDRSIAALSHHCPLVEELTARNVTPGSVTDRSLRALASCPRLRSLTLCPIHCESSAARTNALVNLCSRPWLAHLEVGTTTTFDLFFCAASNIDYYELPADARARHHLRQNLHSKTRKAN